MCFIILLFSHHSFIFFHTSSANFRFSFLFGYNRFVPTSQWKERRYHETWKDGDTMNMSIGQGYTLVTPMHIANMVAMVCNEGKIYKPHLLKEIRDPATNAVIEEIKPQILRESNIDSAVWKEVLLLFHSSILLL